MDANLTSAIVEGLMHLVFVIVMAPCLILGAVGLYKMHEQNQHARASVTNRNFARRSYK